MKKPEIDMQSKRMMWSTNVISDLLDVNIRILHKLQSETDSVNAKDQWDLEAVLIRMGCIK